MIRVFEVWKMRWALDVTGEDFARKFGLWGYDGGIAPVF